MNRDGFDLFTRRFGTAVDRRGLFRATLAAIVVDAFGGLGRVAFAQDTCPGGCAEDEVCTESGCVTPCTRHPDCRDKYDDPCVWTRCIDGVCARAIIECLPGSVCCKGDCCATTCELDSDCTVFDP